MAASKSSYPDKARELALLMADPNVLELLEYFGAEMLLEEKYVPDALSWLVKR